jgi:hypothetical protein
MVFCVGGGELASLDAARFEVIIITYATGRH